MFESKEVKYPDNLPILENDGITKRVYYKIKIEEVQETKRPEVEKKWIHKGNKKVIRDYAYSYEIGEENQKDYLKVLVETGDVITDSNSKDIYEQKFDFVDASEIVLFLNRTR